MNWHTHLHTHTQPLHTSQWLQIFVFSIVWSLHFICLQHVANMMMRMKREFAGTQNQILPVFDTLLLLDRNVDLLTPLATQLTYEGLIDEIYGITNGLNKTLVNLFLRVFFFFSVPSTEPTSPCVLQVMSSCLLRSLQRKNKERPVKISSQSARSCSSTQQRSCMQKLEIKTSTLLEQRLARRLKSFQQPLRLVLLHIYLYYVNELINEKIRLTLCIY